MDAHWVILCCEVQVQKEDIVRQIAELVLIRKVILAGLYCIANQKKDTHLFIHQLNVQCRIYKKRHIFTKIYIGFICL